MAAGFLNIDTNEVQDFLWSHLVPEDIAWGISKYDAYRMLVNEVRQGNQWLAGDLERGVMFRVWIRNPKVIEPHLMGNAMYFRSVFADCLPLAWGKGVEKIMVWTQYPTIGAIIEKLGFTREGFFPRSHLVGGELLDMSVYSLERPHEPLAQI